MSRVPPELIGLDNVMEDFLSESRRKNEKVFEPVGDLWADAHMRFHFPESESEADRKFIESVEKIRAANRLLSTDHLAPFRAMLWGMAVGAILWGALGLIVWMVR